MLKHIVTLILAVALGALAPMAEAQQPPPPAASAPALTDADITRDSACGAPGIGRVWAGERREQIEPRDGKEGYRVNEAGYWEVGCKPPPPPPPPAPCPGTGQPVTWTVGEHTCTTARPRAGTTPTSALHQTLQSGQIQVLRQWIGPMRGTRIERCTDGVRSQVSATCAPATHCDTGWSKTAGSPSVTYSYDARPQAARIPLGGYAQAQGSDGSTLRVQCVAGEIRAAPQCMPGQTVRQVYSGGPIDPVTGEHIGDIRIYRYDGQPLDPGQRATLTQIEGRRKPDGSPRTLIARCSAGGLLR